MNRFVGVFAMFAAGMPAAFAEPSVDEIVHKTNEAAYYQGKDGRAKIKMTIVDKQGRTRVRKLAIIRRDVLASSPGAAEDQQYYLYFEAPADVAKTAFLVHKHVKGDDDRWLYLPALDLVRRIAASDERTSFVGSDFLYEDVSGRGLDKDHHRLVKTTKSYYVLEHTPKQPDAVEFSRYQMWVHKQTFLPTKIEFYDRSDKKYRVYTVEKVDKINGRPTVTRAKMADLVSGGHTVVEYSQIQYDVDLPGRIFAERYLRRPPVKYLP